MKGKILLALALASCLAHAGPDRLQRVREAGELRVCIWPDYYSITYRNAKTRQLTGIDIDIAAALGKDLGVAIRHVDSSFAALRENLLRDRCDIAMHAVGITAERRGILSFTQTYLRSDIYALAAADNAALQSWADLDQPGRVIAVQASTIMESVMRQSLKHARLLVVRPPMTREIEVESGRADAFMTDYPYSRKLLETSDWARLIAPPEPFHMMDYAYALAPGDDSLLQRVNAFMSVIKRDGRLLAFARKHKLADIVVQEPGPAMPAER